MTGTTSSIISNLLSSLERLSPFFHTFTSVVTSSSSSSSSSIGGEDVDSIQKRFMEDLSRLSRMLRRIQAVLHDAEEREIYDKAIQLWLSELREVAYEAEDVLDQYDYQVIKTQVEGMTTTEETMPSLKRKRVDDDDDDNIYDYQVSQPCSTSNKIPISCKMAKRIMKIIEKFDEIAKDRKNLTLKEEDAPTRPYFNDAMKRPLSSSLVHESDVFGREEEKESIIQLLMSQSEIENIVIPIVGMGGVGKTILAQLVYNDPVVCKHFFPKVWVCVSEEFDMLRVTKEIVTSITNSSRYNDNNNLNDLQCILKEALLDKKFLLILDDVWSERLDMWEALRAPFFGMGMGKIIVTTRSMSVASIMQTMPPLKLECLHEENSWLLFKRHAFCGWKPDQQQNFEQIGRAICKKCGGLPLALKVIGGSLRYEVYEEKWEDVLNSSLWELEEVKKYILPALMISYNHLPAYLKPCFLYASIFPKKHRFDKKELIRLWIAQGYIQLTRRNELLETIAFEFFEDLIRRSFFQLKWGNEYTLHDMVHELAQFITKHEIYSSFDLVEYKNIPKDVKHILIIGKMLDWVVFHRDTRTLYLEELYNFFGQEIIPLQNNLPMEPFSHLVCLRVLTFHVLNFECNLGFVDLISNLQQLRYLSIHVCKIQMTENSLCSLYKLQTLILLSPHINILPQEIGKLINLRHLMICCDTFKMLPRSCLELENLLTLIFLPYRKRAFFLKFSYARFESSYDIKRDGLYSCIGWLKHLTNLQGSLYIWNIQNVVNREDAMTSILWNKPHIKSLELHWKEREGNECARQDEAVLDGLQPHTNLEELSIYGYGGSRFPSWFDNPNFSNLKEKQLEDFDNNEECKFLSLSELQSRRSLHIKNIMGIKRIGQDFWCINAPSDGCENYSTKVHACSHSSEYLTNKNMLEWKGCPSMKNGAFSHLKCLYIAFCNELRQISTLPSSLEEFSVKCCKRLEYISLPYSSGSLSRLQNVRIFYCRNLKSIINLNNLVSTLKVFHLFKCELLKPESDEDFYHSFVRVSFEEARAKSCPGMIKWCHWHGIAYDEEDRKSLPSEEKEAILSNVILVMIDSLVSIVSGCLTEHATDVCIPEMDKELKWVGLKKEEDLDLEDWCSKLRMAGLKISSPDKSL